jgi:hypothetical protein
LAVADGKLFPGLLVTEFPRHENQTSEDQAQLPLEAFGKPIGEVSVSSGLAPWHHASNRNAVAHGFLEIPADGEYGFTTDSFYDRNLLMIDGEMVCDFADGGDRIATLALKSGLVEITSAGFIGGRGEGQGIEVRWRPPGQRELSAIPEDMLKHAHPHRAWRVPANTKSRSPIPEQSLFAKYLVLVAKDFVIDVYHNGERVPDDRRGMLLDRFGSSAERVNVEVTKGDWLVFQVAHNRLRHRGSKFFGCAGMLDKNEFGFVSELNSECWSVCDDPALAAQFIAQRQSGHESGSSKIERVWEEGMGFMRKYAGADFKGDPLWGKAPSTWIKFSAGVAPPPLVLSEPEPAAKPEPTAPVQANLALLETRRWPVQIISATYGTGGKNADVTERVKQFVEVERKFFAANPGHLGADPNPHWNKSLHIIYRKGGVRREVRYNENGHVLPESFYGPQDSAELEGWLIGTRWDGSSGQVQFNQDGTATGRGVKPGARWEATGGRKVRFTWSEKETTEFQFDYIWSRFGDPALPLGDYKIVR